MFQIWYFLDFFCYLRVVTVLWHSMYIFVSHWRAIPAHQAIPRLPRSGALVEANKCIFDIGMDKHMSLFGSTYKRSVCDVYTVCLCWQAIWGWSHPNSSDLSSLTHTRMKKKTDTYALIRTGSFVFATACPVLYFLCSYLAKRLL